MGSARVNIETESFEKRSLSWSMRLSVENLLALPRPVRGARLADVLVRPLACCQVESTRRPDLCTYRFRRDRCPRRPAGSPRLRDARRRTAPCRRRLHVRMVHSAGRINILAGSGECMRMIAGLGELLATLSTVDLACWTEPPSESLVSSDHRKTSVG